MFGGFWIVALWWEQATAHDLFLIGLVWFWVFYGKTHLFVVVGGGATVLG